MFQKMKRLGLLQVLGLFLLAVGLVVLLDIGCFFRYITGVPCPGCGMTRAHLAVLRLDFQEAFFYHPLWFLPLPLLAGSALFPNGLFRNRKWDTAGSILLLILVLGVYGVRMALYFPHTPPMDYSSRNLLGWVLSLFQGIPR